MKSHALPPWEKHAATWLTASTKHGSMLKPILSEKHSAKAVIASSAGPATHMALSPALARPQVIFAMSLLQALQPSPGLHLMGQASHLPKELWPPPLHHNPEPMPAPQSHATR